MRKPSIKEIEIKQFTQKEATRENANAFFTIASSGFGGESPWSAESLFQSLEAENSTIFYAHTEGKKVGFLVASETPFILDIYMVVVAEPYKNKKLGRYLFQALIQYAKEKKIPEIILETRKSNHPAIALYERVGFQKVGERKAYYSSPIEDAMVMKLVVGEEK